MIGYILMGLGAYLIYDDLKQSKRVKKGGRNDNLSQNGRGGAGSNSISEPGADDQERGRNRGVIGIPTEKSRKGGKSDGQFFNRTIQQVEPDKDSDSTGDNLHREPDTTTGSSKTESVTKKSDKGGKHAKHKSDIKDGAGNDGDDVRPESVSSDKSHSTKTD